MGVRTLVSILYFEIYSVYGKSENVQLLMNGFNLFTKLFILNNVTLRLVNIYNFI